MPRLNSTQVYWKTVAGWLKVERAQIILNRSQPGLPRSSSSLSPVFGKLGGPRMHARRARERTEKPNNWFASVVSFLAGIMANLVIRSCECKVRRQGYSDCSFMSVFTAVYQRDIQLQFIINAFTDLQLVFARLDSGNSIDITTQI